MGDQQPLPGNRIDGAQDHTKTNQRFEEGDKIKQLKEEIRKLTTELSNIKLSNTNEILRLNRELSNARLTKPDEIRKLEKDLWDAKRSKHDEIFEVRKEKNEEISKLREDLLGTRLSTSNELFQLRKENWSIIHEICELRIQNIDKVFKPEAELRKATDTKDRSESNIKYFRFMSLIWLCTFIYTMTLTYHIPGTELCNFDPKNGPGYALLLADVWLFYAAVNVIIQCFFVPQRIDTFAYGYISTRTVKYIMSYVMAFTFAYVQYHSAKEICLYRWAGEGAVAVAGEQIPGLADFPRFHEVVRDSMRIFF